VIEEVEVPEVEPGEEPGDAGKSEAISEPVVEVEAEVATTPAPPSRSSRASRSSAPVAPEQSDVTVSLSSVVYRKSRRNSASVAAVQDRLVALGFGAARSDLRGWFHEGTREAVAAFQKAEGMAETGEVDAATLDALLSGTGAVAVA
jgi:peptidoglycan hydrolase-like protein with peptidoglycan-binding domain